MKSLTSERNHFPAVPARQGAHARAARLMFARQGFHQRQPDEQVTAMPTQQSEARYLHDPCMNSG